MTKKKRFQKLFKNLLLFGLPLALILPSYARMYVIDGGSMAPTTFPGDKLLVNLAAYDLKVPYGDRVLAKMGSPERGHLVIYDDPRGFAGMKRVVGVPGDVVEMKKNEVFINGKSILHSMPEELEIRSRLSQRELDGLKVALGDIFVEEQAGEIRYIISFKPGRSEKESFGPVTVPEGSYFLLGDHRDFSGDSRFEFQGFMKREQLIGKVIAGARSLSE